MQRDVILKFFIDISPGNRRQASSENRTQGGKPTLSENSKKYNSWHQNFWLNSVNKEFENNISPHFFTGRTPKQRKFSLASLAYHAR